MSTPQVIMIAHMSLNHIRQPSATFLRFIQRCGITSRKLCTALFRHLILSLRFLLSRLCEKQWRRVSLSSLGLTKPKINEESGSTINAEGQSHVSGGLNQYRVYAYYFAAHYWWADHHSLQQRSMLSLSFYPSTAGWFKCKFFTNAGHSHTKSWNALSKRWSNHAHAPYICVWRV